MFRSVDSFMVVNAYGCEAEEMREHQDLLNPNWKGQN